MRTNYTLLCYRVMYRRNEDEKWNFGDFSTEEEAVEFFKTVLSNYYETKLLKIYALESWWK